MKPELTEPERAAQRPVQRRQFLQVTGAAGALLVLGACSDETTFAPTVPPDSTTPPPTGGTQTINLGSGDTGVLNYAYLLEQLEAAFYERVTQTPYSGISGEELTLLSDVRDHEISHREFLRAALGAAAIPTVPFNFSAINFNSRQSVLETARTFEDLGVAAYNGAGKLLSNPAFLLVAGKIVSVEARHAAAIRDLLQPRTRAFAGDDVVNASGLDKAMSPSEVLAAAGPFVAATVNATNLPTS